MIHDTSCQMACDGCHGDVAVAPAFAQLLVNSEYIRAALLKNSAFVANQFHEGRENKKTLPEHRHRHSKGREVLLRGEESQY